MAGGRWLEPTLTVQGRRWDPALDRTPLHHQVHSHPLPHSFRLGQQVKHANSPPMHILGVWQETGILGENPRRQWPQTRIDFFFFHHQCYNKTMMLFKDLCIWDTELVPLMPRRRWLTNWSTSALKECNCITWVNDLLLGNILSFASTQG